jgi:hypothetical protein
MESYLEKICYLVDSVLAQHGLSAKIAGGYVAGNGLLLSLSDSSFVNTGVRHDIQKALAASQVLSTVGVVLIHDYSPYFEPGTFASEIIEGEFEVRTAQPVETIDVLALIADHQDQALAS